MWKILGVTLMLISVVSLIGQEIYIGSVGWVFLLIAIVCGVLGLSLLIFDRWKNWKNCRSRS